VWTSEIDKSVAVLRALLTEDFDVYRRLNTELEAGASKVFAAVLGATFVEAATRRFGEKPDIAAVIEFVTEMRAVYSRTGEVVSAQDAENMIRGALGEDRLLDNMDARTMGAAQTAMLFAIAHEGNYADKQIDDLLTVAKDRASSYFRRTHPS
jgi:hypothetical protein